MNLLKQIGKPEGDESKFELRFATRAVLQDLEGLVPMLYVSEFKYHKLPGGGIEGDETNEEALKRECLEEIGAEIEIVDELGMIIEYRMKWNLKQTSYCYYGKIISKDKGQSFTERELSQGFQLEWYSLEEAIDTVKNDSPQNYEGKFIQERDLALLESAFSLLANNINGKASN